MRFSTIQIRIYRQEFAGQILNKEQKQELWDRAYYEISDNNYKKDECATEATNKGLSESTANLYADLCIRIEEKSGLSNTGTALEIAKIQESRMYELEKKYGEEGHYQCLLEGMKIYDQFTKVSKIPDQAQLIKMQMKCDHELNEQHATLHPQLEQINSQSMHLL